MWLAGNRLFLFPGDRLQVELEQEVEVESDIVEDTAAEDIVVQDIVEEGVVVDTLHRLPGKWLDQQ